VNTVVLQTLRRETRELHRLTERALDLRLASSTRAEYQVLLERLLGIYAPLEEQLFSRVPVAPGIEWELRRKTPLLQADLRTLQPDGSVQVQFCAGMPALNSPQALLGAWYVVEGATLGGQIIAAHLLRQLGLAAHNGARFFDCYGELRQQRWDEFCSVLSSTPAREAEEVASGAVQVFATMRQWLADRPRARAAD
jgi:heme oxygenase